MPDDQFKITGNFDCFVRLLTFEYLTKWLNATNYLEDHYLLNNNYNCMSFFKSISCKSNVVSVN